MRTRLAIFVIILTVVTLVTSAVMPVFAGTGQCKASASCPDGSKCSCEGPCPCNADCPASGSSCPTNITGHG